MNFCFIPSNAKSELFLKIKSSQLQLSTNKIFRVDDLDKALPYRLRKVFFRMSAVVGSVFLSESNLASSRSESHSFRSDIGLHCICIGFFKGRMALYPQGYRTLL